MTALYSIERQVLTCRLIQQSQAGDKLDQRAAPL
jgi:hypothetical protein